MNQIDYSDSLVYIVDDEAPAREMVGDYLKMHGFNVTLCDGGKSLRETIAKQTPDLIVLDVMLPDLDGFEVCRRLRSDGSDVPIIFLTAAALGYADTVLGSVARDQLFGVVERRAGRNWRVPSASRPGFSCRTSGATCWASPSGGSRAPSPTGCSRRWSMTS